MSACLDKVALWMRSNRLQLNTSKTKVLWYATSRRQDQIPTDPIRVGGDLISPATSVRDLGIYLDSDASMRTRFEDRVELLCRTPPDPQYTSVCFQAGDAVHGGVAGSAAT